MNPEDFSIIYWLLLPGSCRYFYLKGQYCDEKSLSVESEMLVSLCYVMHHWASIIKPLGASVVSAIKWGQQPCHGTVLRAKSGLRYMYFLGINIPSASLSLSILKVGYPVTFLSSRPHFHGRYPLISGI